MTEPAVPGTVDWHDRVLNRPDVRQALADRDIGRLFALAKKWGGLSYHRIAEACRIKPERVGKLARGQGSITSYGKLCDIADGLRVPGALLGLSRRPWESEPSPTQTVRDSSPQPRSGSSLDLVVVDGSPVVGAIPLQPAAFQQRHQLDLLVEQAGGVSVVCAVTGQRGVGKTQLAAAYARKRAAEGWLVAWIGAGTNNEMLSGMIELADRLGLRPTRGATDVALRRLRDYLQSRKEPALLVFDNVEDPDLVAPYLPSTGNNHVVVTSTTKAAEQLGDAIPVDVYDSNTAVQFLRDATGLGDDASAHEVAECLGYLPLALAQAADRIRIFDGSYQTFIERFRTVDLDRLLGRRPGGPYPRGTAEAVLLAIEPFRADPLARELFDAIALLSPDGVSRAVLHAGRDGQAVDRIVGRLYDASIVKFVSSRHTVAMHRITQRILRDSARRANRYAAALDGEIDRIDGLRFSGKDAWPRRELGDELVSHIEALWANSVGHPELAERLFPSRVWTIRQLGATSAFRRSVELGERVVRDASEILGSEHPVTLQAAHNLAKTYSWARSVRESIKMFQETLEKRWRVLGMDDSQTLITASQLGSKYRWAGQLREAIPLLEGTLSTQRRVLGESHRDALRTAYRLGVAYRQAGNIEESIELLTGTLDAQRRKLGTDDYHTILTHGGLATSFRWAGRMRDSLAIVEEEVPRRKRALGSDHPYTLNIMGRLTLMRSYFGQVEQGAAQMLAAYQALQRVLGDQHQDTLSAADRHGEMCRRLGDYDEAARWHEYAFSEQCRILGESHQNSMFSANSLARSYACVGMIDEAIALQERTLAAQVRELGEDHRHALITGNSLAVSYRIAGRYAEAIRLHKRILTSQQRTLGDSNLCSLITTRDLATTYAQIDRTRDAADLLAAAHPVTCVILGASSPLARSMQHLLNAT